MSEQRFRIQSMVKGENRVLGRPNNGDKIIVNLGSSSSAVESKHGAQGPGLGEKKNPGLN
jgi:hypothetical protein